VATKTEGSEQKSSNRRAMKASLIDRFMLRLSSAVRIDGLWVGSFDSNALPRVEEAVRLIKQYDRTHYRHLICDLDRVWVTVLPSSIGRYKHSLKMCEIDERFVLADSSTPEMIAAVIVHEATHARLMRCNIGYGEELRARVEAVCFRRERSFAAKLPNGQQIRDQADGRLVGYRSDYWTNTAFAERRHDGEIQMLRYLGVPDWVTRAGFRVRSVLWRGVRNWRRLRSLLSRGDKKN
jgi:hypothetical protein